MGFFLGDRLIWGDLVQPLNHISKDITDLRRQRFGMNYRPEHPIKAYLAGSACYFAFFHQKSLEVLQRPNYNGEERLLVVLKIPT